MAGTNMAFTNALTVLVAGTNMAHQPFDCYNG